MRYHRAINSYPSKRTIKDIENWLAKMKWLEKIRWKTKKRTEAICKAAEELDRHREQVDRDRAKRWADKYIETYFSDEIKKDFFSFVSIARKVVHNSSSVQGFTILPTEKAKINNTVVPLIALRNKYKNKTICIYKDFADGVTSIQDYYNHVGK